MVEHPRGLELPAFQAKFGQYGLGLYELACSTDHKKSFPTGILSPCQSKTNSSRMCSCRKHRASAHRFSPLARFASGVGLNPGQHFRVIGVGLSNFREPEDSSDNQLSSRNP